MMPMLRGTRRILKQSKHTGSLPGELAVIRLAGHILSEASHSAWKTHSVGLRGSLSMFCICQHPGPTVLRPQTTRLFSSCAHVIVRCFLGSEKAFNWSDG